MAYKCTVPVLAAVFAINRGAIGGIFGIKLLFSFTISLFLSGSLNREQLLISVHFVKFVI
jgi:hypothetical protein